MFRIHKKNNASNAFTYRQEYNIYAYTMGVDVLLMYTLSRIRYYTIFEEVHYVQLVTRRR